MAQGNFITYKRVSTVRQGKSGLGLEAQEQAITSYLNGGKWKVVGQYVETESGRNDARPQLEKALQACRVHNATLLVAKVDRLTRSVGFLHKLLEAGVDVTFCDLPQIEGAVGRFMLTQMAAVAELEAGFISSRTKAALAQAKKRGVKLGGNRGKLTPDIVAKAVSNSAKVRSGHANARAADLSETLQAYVKQGLSLQAIAEELNGQGIKTARGCEWKAMSVKRVLDRLA